MPTVAFNDAFDNAAGNLDGVGSCPGCISADPLFLDIGNEDFRVPKSSPCINRGTMECVPITQTECVPKTDIVGMQRPCINAGWNDIAIDIGAYEYCGAEEPVPPVLFTRGDTNADTTLDIADVIYTLSHLFASGPASICLDAADANDDGAIDIADGIAILSYLFAASGPLPEPFGKCGGDPTEDLLDCISFPPCEG